MTKAELEKKIKELEKRLKQLEQQPSVISYPAVQENPCPFLGSHITQSYE